MNINSNVGLRDRSRITLGGFKGLDTLSAAVDVSAIHATEMQNLISRDGVNHKRFGWKTQFRIRDNCQYLKIQGIFDFTIYHIKFLMVYAGYKKDGKDNFGFYLIDSNNNTSANITNISLDDKGKIDKNEKGECINTTVSPVDFTNLRDKECKCFINGNKVYFVGCGDFLVFSKWTNGKFELRRVVGNEDVYVPTTTENIGCEEDGQHYTRISAEERNILSPITKNLLFGPELLLTSEDGENSFEEGQETENKIFDRATYYLDNNDLKDIKVSIERCDGKTIVLKHSKDSVATYQRGDSVKFTEFTLENISLERETSGSINETVKYVEHSDRWTSYDQAYDELYKITGSYSAYHILPDFGIYKAEAANVLNESGEKCGTYQGYLDYIYKKYVGKDPNLTTKTGEYRTITTRFVKKSCEILLGINDLIELITMEDGGVLAIRNEVKGYSEYYSSAKIEDVEIYYKKPEKISFSLVYIKANGSETVLRTVSERNVSCSIIRETKNSITANITYSYGTLSCDLSKYEPKIFEFNLTGVDYYGCNDENIVLTPNGNEEDSNGYRAQANLLSGILTLFAVKGDETAYAPHVPDVPNIEVEITRHFDASIITSTNVACEFGTQGGADRLFLVDNTGNIIRWSKNEDFTYFGEKSWCACGTPYKSITGMSRLNDKTLLIAKEYSPKEPSIFVITGDIVTGNTEAGTVDYTALFTPHGYQVDMGAVGEIVNFNGECLIVAKDGLYAVSLGENMTVDSRYVLHRSRQISNKLEKFELANAKCVSFNGKFFVAVGGKEQECYVADNKYTTSFKGDIQNVVNYEWWRWTNIPVNVWGIVDNKLWFGTNDGQLCTFTENFYDETILNFSEPNLGYATNEDGEIIGLYSNSNIPINVGDILTPTSNFFGAIITNKFESGNGETKFYLPLKDFNDNEKIYIYGEGYPITKHSLYFSIHYETTSTEVTIYKNYKNRPLIVTDTSNDIITLKDRDNNFPKWSAVESQGGFNPSNENFTATLSHKEPVISKWVSGAMDLGTRAYSKSLTYLVLTGEKDLANRLKYGLKTRFTHRDYELLRANNDLDFTGLDLQTVSMDSDFGSSYTKRLNIRNVNFLILYYQSDTAEDVAINSIQIEFKVYKRNIGVR